MGPFGELGLNERWLNVAEGLEGYTGGSDIERSVRGRDDSVSLSGLGTTVVTRGRGRLFRVGPE